MGTVGRSCCCKKIVKFPVQNISTLVEKGEASMKLCVIVGKTVFDWAVNLSAGGKYSCCFWVKCEDSAVRSAAEVV
jgi:hypothetical protein